MPLRRVAFFIFMEQKYWVYILRSSEGKYYIGQTNDIERRLNEHEVGISIWTRKYTGWELIYKEEYSSRSEAMIRERVLKRLKGGDVFKRLVAGESGS